MNLDNLKKWLIPEWQPLPPPVPPGLYHYQRAADGTYTRFHLRVEPDEQGMLLANATLAARLSPAGVLMAKGVLDGRPPADILAAVRGRFRGASDAEMAADLRRVRDLIDTLAAPGDNYPVVNLWDAAVSPDESRLLAPWEASLPLAPPAQLVPLLDRLWEAGIPHVTFLAPPGADAAQLLRAVERAEDLGMIAGVRGRATDLWQGTLLPDLAQAGVDHVTVLHAAADAAVHDALCGAGDHGRLATVYDAIQTAEVCPVAEIPLVAQTVAGLRDTLDDLTRSGVVNASFFAIAAADDAAADGAIPARAMPQTADWVEELAAQLDLRFIWQPPVARETAVSLAAQVQAGPRCSGDVAVRVEPNGDVIPPRGRYRAAGNLLQDDWPKIWRHPAFVRYRDRVTAPTRCAECPGLVICAADCPREPAGWAQGGAL
ncbi:MAG: SPASM domain-containing protein [Anaerolineales bacterium]|nr:SPASM domain-containing protein [Anaerolineales bacterium]